MTIAVNQETRPGRAPVAIVDCDIHNELASEATLRRYLPEHWRWHRETFGPRLMPTAYPSPTNALASRTDAWPPEGGPPGSSLAMLRAQLLDPWQAERGILNPMPLLRAERNLEHWAAIARAVNDWQIAEWLEPEPRLRASISVAYEDGDLAAAEIDRLGTDPRFVQVLVFGRTAEPLGRRKYWRLYEAATRHDLPVGVHVGGRSGGPITGAGWPSYYFEHHAALAADYQAQVTSLVFEGVFERFPTLKIVFIESGFAWLPPLMARLDRTWRLLGEEVPHVRRPPSEYIREHVWITTQPIEEPPRDEQLVEVMDELAMPDQLMFASDYPHWDFDAPDLALPSRLPPDTTRRILADNARALYRL